MTGILAPSCARLHSADRSRGGSRARRKWCAGQSRDNATWLSVAHPGLGEFYLRAGARSLSAPRRRSFGWASSRSSVGRATWKPKSIYDVRKRRP